MHGFPKIDIKDGEAYVWDGKQWNRVLTEKDLSTLVLQLEGESKEAAE